MKFDTFLATVDDWGKFQKVKYTTICLAYMLPSIMVYTYTFTAGIPKFRCQNPDLIHNDSYNNVLNGLFNENYRPTDNQCHQEHKGLSVEECGKCYIQSRLESNQSSSQFDGKLEKCDKYVFDNTYYTKTLVEEVRRMKEKKFYLKINIFLVEYDL